ncbi:MAG TPA: NAD-binding protein [Candidatus Acidoferrales bacterium]|nr:NAD-binding protein [Candidatus Acidoferrales bacterium]
MVHVVVAGTGRVGGQVASTLIFERYVTQLSLVDTAPRVAEMTKEEMHHAIASHGFDVEINAYENSKLVEDADLIIIAAGFPRTPEMSRRDLATKNAAAVRQTVADTVDNNPDAWYFVITNPVDAMTTLANKTALGKRPIIGTGTNLETSRFRTILCRELKVPIGNVEAYAGGEHGEAAVLLWSTVKINGLQLDEYLKKTGKKLDRGICENYVKEVSRQVITFLGGTRYGPAGSFIEIIRGILLNTGKVISYSRPKKFETTPEPVYVTVPARIAKSLGPDLWDLLAKSEQEAIKQAAGIIYKTYCEAVGGKS